MHLQKPINYVFSDNKENERRERGMNKGKRERKKGKEVEKKQEGRKSK